MRRRKVTQGDILLELAKAERIARQDREDALVIEICLEGEDQRAAERIATKEELQGRASRICPLRPCNLTACRVACIDGYAKATREQLRGRVE